MTFKIHLKPQITVIRQFVAFDPPVLMSLIALFPENFFDAITVGKKKFINIDLKNLGLFGKAIKE